jgi:hypothetical protein
MIEVSYNKKKGVKKTILKRLQNHIGLLIENYLCFENIKKIYEIKSQTQNIIKFYLLLFYLYHLPEMIFGL